MGAELTREVMLRIPLPSPELAQAALRALKPEAERPPTGRFEAEVGLEGSTLVVRIRARDTSSLRAALNSYLSWVRAVRDVCLTVSGARPGTRE